MKRTNFALPLSALIIGSFAIVTKAENNDNNTRASYSAESKVERKSDGTYKSDTTVTQKDKDGTVSTDKEVTSAGSTLLGNEKVTTTKKSTVNPPGLMNEQKTTSRAETVTDSQGNVDRNVKVESVDAEGTARVVKRDMKTELNADGSKQTTTHVKETTDPKGLMNKTVQESQRTVTEPKPN